MRLICLLLTVLLCSALRAQPGGVRLLLPPEIPAVPGREVNLYFDNVVLHPRSDMLLFDVDCPRGIQQQERFVWTPKPEDVGVFGLTLRVYDLDDKLVAEGKTKIHVYAPDAGAGKPVTALIVGDSLTAAMVYTDELAKLMAAPGNPQLTLIGTNGTGALRSEGYGGWTAQRFVTLWGPDAITPEGRRGRSPFLFEENGKPVLDFQKYCDAQNAGKGPDLITILLGCNDTFNARESALEAAVDDFLKHLDTLIAEFHRVRPDTKIGVITLLPPASSQDSSGAVVGCAQTRWQYRRNVHRVIEKTYERYGAREAENLFVVPAYVNFDAVHNVPTVEVTANARNDVKIVRQNNDVHPAASGYRQLADSLYCWMKGTVSRQ
ncbi:MAG: SGNH/GDSL hydrolase family protein [Armatimonadetes bacterium]|nr:SGNH/GDSL hydrolase family protein [Armatimonadota bacterium]